MMLEARAEKIDEKRKLISKAMEAETKVKEKCTAAAAAGAHVLIFPCPAQGHIISMLKLAELLVLNDLHVTFLNTEYIHHRLIRFGDIEALSACYHPTLQFKTISDCYTEEQDLQQHPGFGDRVGDVITSINSHAKPLLRDILVSESPAKPRISCFIGDGMFGSLTTDLAGELGIPLIHFRTISACCFWAYLCVPKLFECNELPIKGDDDMDRIITSTPGMENLLRCRDLPSFCRPKKKGHIHLDSMVFQTQQSLRANALILNTFEDLEGPVLSQIRLHFPKLYTIGPLHHHLNMRKTAALAKPSLPHPSFKNNFFEVDRSCMAWLDAQPERSVIYVSFGSVTLVTRMELMEIWHGLVNSKKRFLWVMRPDLVAGKEGEDKIPVEVEEGTKDRGFMVEWAPQEEVLAHKAIGGFMTHSGWNSTIESVVAGVPMICWPYFADQQINSRFVSEAWKLGLDMKDVCDRNVVEKMVNDVMVHRRDEFLISAKAMSMLAHKSVSPGGSSYSSFDDLIHYIKISTSQGNH
ncbi:7-deoxyloganetic acid glucosyltransferase-like [Gastrolobium bilobum]|uniref:7-deoxyloganetic acid glucosyltransferase-like n=1 Tax=Gastrolobium bilobum TaxID=150636 RepID=UPI002AB0285B|nr:7-deoxyloganetic acid glucosyltransferase-like [Gastrolobium bilobum]